MILAFSTGMVRAQQENALPAPEIIFVTSTGYWEESLDAQDIIDPNGQAADKKPQARQKQQEAVQRGYYKLIAARQPEGYARIYLQQIASSKDGPKIVSSAELEEFSSMKAYVTDIRPERSDGVTPQPGLFATVYLKTDPASTEPETWTVLIDDIGDIRIERATN